MGNDKPLRDFKPPADVRRSSLEALSLDELTVILTRMGRKCDECTTIGHWASKVRHTVLELKNKAIQNQLTKRGVRCESCSSREQYVDRLLDSVHLPYAT